MSQHSKYEARARAAELHTEEQTQGRDPLHSDDCHCDKCSGNPQAKASNPKDVIGSTKPTFSTVPHTFTALLGAAWLEGGLKYGRHNYRVVGVRASIYFDACMRHLFKWWELGEWIDADSGLPHVVKAAACLGVILDAQVCNKLNDDRPPTVPAEFWKYVEQVTKEIIDRAPKPPVEPFTEIKHGKKENQ